MSAVVIAASVAALAAVSSVWAGSGPPAGSEYQFSAQPRFLTRGAGGILKGTFRPDPASGSATHVAFSFDIPTGATGFTFTRPSNCLGPASTAFPLTSGYTRVTCEVGTVNAGVLATQFLQFSSSATTALIDHPFKGFVTFDKGTGGKGGGGGSTNSKGPEAGTVTVVEAGHTTRAGSCVSGSASASTNTSLSMTNTQSTSVTASSALPCTYVFAGEEPAPGTSHTEVSFFVAPPTPTGSFATATIVFYKLPVAFKDFKLFYELTTDVGEPFAYTDELRRCADRPVPPNPICLASLTKQDNGAIAVIRFIGTGSDPRVGG